MRSGKETLFLERCLLYEAPLKLVFPKIFDYCRNKNSLVSECMIDGQWQFDFTRTFGPEEVQEWEELLTKLFDINLGLEVLDLIIHEQDLSLV